MNLFTTLFAALSVEETLATVATAGVALLLAAVLFLTSRKKSMVRTRTYGAVAVALSFVLSFIKIPIGAIGTGSITLASSIPLVIYAYFFGLPAGAVVGLIYGALQFLQNPYFMTPVQFLFDYVLAFGAPMIAGLIAMPFKKDKVGLPVAVALCGVLRLLMHTFAGMIFYYEWKVAELPIFGNTAAMGPFIYSFLYNLSYMMFEIAIAVAVSIPLARSKAVLRIFADASGREIRG